MMMKILVLLFCISTVYVRAESDKIKNLKKELDQELQKLEEAKDVKKSLNNDQLASVSSDAKIAASDAGYLEPPVRQWLHTDGSAHFFKNAGHPDRQNVLNVILQHFTKKKKIDDDDAKKDLLKEEADHALLELLIQEQVEKKKKEAEKKEVSKKDVKKEDASKKEADHALLNLLKEEEEIKKKEAVKKDAAEKDELVKFLTAREEFKLKKRGAAKDTGKNEELRISHKLEEDEKKKAVVKKEAAKQDELLKFLIAREEAKLKKREAEKNAGKKEELEMLHKFEDEKKETDETEKLLQLLIKDVQTETADQVKKAVVEKDDGCKNVGDEKYCASVKGFCGSVMQVKSYCKKTCGACGKVKVQKQKVDENCRDWKSEIYCSRMKMYCQDYKSKLEGECDRTCGYCKPCIDVWDNCAMHSEDVCHSIIYQDRLKKNCAKHCGFCGRVHAPPACQNMPDGCCWDGKTPADDGCPQCRDQFKSACKKFSDDCNARSQKEFMTQNCPVTCGLCDPTKECSDHLRKAECSDKKKMGQCDCKPSLLHPRKCDLDIRMHYCRETCGTCSKK